MIAAKKCYRCKEVKPLSEFYYSPAQTKKRGKTMYFSNCKKCSLLDGLKKAPPLKEYQIFFDIENEKWLPIIGYEGLYEISDLGRIKSFRGRTKLRKQILTKEGYLRVQLSKDGMTACHFAHILVATAFIPNPENKPTVNHKKGIKTDNRASELEWATQKEQMEHALKLGLYIPPKGEDKWNSFLTNEQVLEIFNSNESYKTLSSKYGIHRRIISNIKRGYCYRSITKKTYDRTGRNKKYSSETVLAVFNSSLPHKKIKEMFGIHLSAIAAIKTGIQYSSITGKIYEPKRRTMLSSEL